jgi:hypothetical protein
LFQKLCAFKLEEITAEIQIDLHCNDAMKDKFKREICRIQQVNDREILLTNYKLCLWLFFRSSLKLKPV